MSMVITCQADVYTAVAALADSCDPEADRARILHCARLAGLRLPVWMTCADDGPLDESWHHANVRQELRTLKTRGSMNRSGAEVHEHLQSYLEPFVQMHNEYHAKVQATPEGRRERSSDHGVGSTPAHLAGYGEMLKQRLGWIRGYLGNQGGLGGEKTFPHLHKNLDAIHQRIHAGDPMSPSELHLHLTGEDDDARAHPMPAPARGLARIGGQGHQGGAATGASLHGLIRQAAGR